MTTNNHPAHGPVSLDRLHQIREILSKAAAQSDGGNLGYAMADAVKVINGAIAAFGAEPVGTFRKGPCGYYPSFHEDAVPLYAAPPVPVVPDEDPRDAFERTFKMPKHVTRCGTGYAVTEYSAWLAHDFIRMWEGWKACRAAMLQAGNSPVTPDGWIPVSERMPPNKPGSYEYIVFDSLNNKAHHDYWNVPDGSCDEFTPFWNHYGKYVTHWMPLPEPPSND